jgi:class 3 adenylate cyclase
MKLMSLGKKYKQFKGIYVWMDMRNYTQFVRNKSVKQVDRLLRTYFATIKKQAKKQQGKVVSYLGDGVGVLFKNQSQDAFEFAKKTIQELKKQNLPLHVGAAMAVGKMISINIEGKAGYFYTGEVAFLAYGIGSLLSNTKIEILITSRVYKSLNKKSRDLLIKAGEKEIKGFGKPVVLYRNKSPF